uniref:Uncharacterized protein n=1 Tax=Scleropages formosus TaxID=113540 RepID=A0A8C9VNK9_SCLFO
MTVTLIAPNCPVEGAFFRPVSHFQGNTASGKWIRDQSENRDGLKQDSGACHHAIVFDSFLQGNLQCWSSLQ